MHQAEFERLEKFNFDNINLQDIQLMDEVLILADARNGIVTLNFTSFMDNTLGRFQMVKQMCISLPQVTKFRMYGNTLVVFFYDVEYDPYLAEFHYFPSKVSTSAAETKRNSLFFYNRIVGDMTPINLIRMDDTFAYLIGNNIHYAYKHSIHHDFM